MCGRFSQLSKLKNELNFMFDISEFKAFHESFNISPTQTASVVRMNDNRVIVDELKWGLIPSGSKSEAIGNLLINARNETITEKRSFKDSVEHKRCVVPMSGYYEWVKNEYQKQPYYFKPENESLFLAAGLWSSWTNKDNKIIDTFSIITVPATISVKEYHHRQPVLLKKEESIQWLKIKTPLVGSEAIKIKSHPVSFLVNNTRTNSEECIKRIEPVTILPLF
jgi:putative SOS response-associated peptidase YedK